METSNCKLTLTDSSSVLTRTEGPQPPARYRAAQMGASSEQGERKQEERSAPGAPDCMQGVGLRCYKRAAFLSGTPPRLTGIVAGTQPKLDFNGVAAPSHPHQRVVCCIGHAGRRLWVRSSAACLPTMLHPAVTVPLTIQAVIAAPDAKAGTLNVAHNIVDKLPMERGRGSSMRVGWISHMDWG